MERVLETLIATESQHDHKQPKKARMALNIRVREQYGERYRKLMYSSWVERNISSSNDLSDDEVYALLKYTETAQHDTSKPI